MIQRRARLVPILTSLAVLATLMFGASAASAAVPPAPRAFSAAIEPMAPYQPQRNCSPYLRPGTKALATLLVRTYPGTTWAGVYKCGTDGLVSEHYGGRAIDWMTSASVGWQRADATSFVTWLLATDRFGNSFAMARRLGVMYVIWNNRMWGAWDGRWHDYNGCSTSTKLKAGAYDNACHRTHVHISLDWSGARAQTSFWTGQVAP